MQLQKDIALLIPAYNEQKYIEGVIKSCAAYKMDIIIIDDGSQDNTVDVVESTDESRKGQVILLKHETNKGKGRSLLTGFEYILKHGYQGVITLDADGQHDVMEIPNFIKKIELDHPDIIVGNRLDQTGDMPFIRLATNVFTSWLISQIGGKKIKDVQCGYRYINSKVLQQVKIETANFDTEPEILLKASWLGFNIQNIPIKTIYHQDFTSYVNPVTDTIKFFKLVFRSLKQKRKVMASKKQGQVPI
ncbi:MAG: glycosyltransferase family 2 protein [Actinomycetota bacterium]|nr:glycosyltransferase family 2 protein [Actinomycetota bacterium]